MGVFTLEAEYSSSIAPARLFKAIVLDNDNLIPKLVPQGIKCIEVLEGNGGPGTIKKITFSEGSQYGYMTFKLESIDEENLVYCYSKTKGDVLPDKVANISYKTQFFASPEGGSIIKINSTYETIGDFEIKEEHVKGGREKAAGLIKLVEDYLVANPEDYN